MYDVVIVGGSISGLLCAREAAAQGCSVLVLERDHEIGTPEHCGGLVSQAALGRLGLVPRMRTLDHFVESAQVFAPDGSSITIDAKRRHVACVSRRELDKQAAMQAQKAGAKIRVGMQVQQIDRSGVKAGRETISGRVIVDARGVAPLVSKDRSGALVSAQHEVYADWIQKGRVEVYIDQQKYPGFFAWVIPSSLGGGRVGVAGRAINAAGALREFLDSRGGYCTIREISAPIWVNGPIQSFVTDRTVTIGDAAGLAKPTTAGGIYSCGMSGIIAGRQAAEFVRTHDEGKLRQYQDMWSEIFGDEFGRQLKTRRIAEGLDNATINKLFGAVTPEIVQELSSGDEFDFHAGSILRLLGTRGAIKAAGAIVEGKIKNLF